MKTSTIFGGLVSLALLICLSSIAMPVSPVQAEPGNANFSIVPATTSIRQNQIFTVDIKVDASSQPLDGAQAYLDFDPNYLRVVDADGNETTQIINGELYSSTWPDVLTNIVNNSTGQINYAAGKGITGSAANTLFTLATIRFKAITQTGDTATALILNTNIPRATKAVYGLDTVTGTITNGTATISSAAVPSLSAGVTSGKAKLPGVTNVINSVTAEGRFTENVIARSEDGKVYLTIAKNTIGKNKGGARLFSIKIAEITEQPALPADSAVIGPVYDITPDGATFDPPIELSMKYNESEIPEGVAEGNLLMATWDETTSQWVELESTVDEGANRVTATISHFTAFTILAHTSPARFTISNLVITPSEISIREGTSISVTITNNGDLTGTYEVIYKVANSTVETKNVTLIGGGKETVSFSLVPVNAGEYTIDVNGLVGVLRVNKAKEVKEAKEAAGLETPRAAAAFNINALTISPTEADIGESVDVTVTVTNIGEVSGTYGVTLKINDVVVETKEISLAGGASKKVTFTTTKDVPGRYEVNISGLSGTFSVKAPLVSPVNWSVIGSIIAGGVLVIVLILWMILSRQRAKGVKT